MKTTITPGTIVLNQYPNNPLSGEVIEPPDKEQELDGLLWVRWANGIIELESPADLTLTAQIHITLTD